MMRAFIVSACLAIALGGGLRGLAEDADGAVADSSRHLPLGGLDDSSSATLRDVVKVHVPKVSALDIAWLRSSTEFDLFEIEKATLGLTRAKDHGVKSILKSLIKQHKVFLHRKEKLAHALGVKLPHIPSLRMKVVLKALAHLSGLKFDKKFLNVNIVETKHAIKAATLEVKKGRSLSVKVEAKHELKFLTHDLAVLVKLRKGLVSTSYPPVVVLNENDDRSSSNGY